MDAHIKVLYSCLEYPQEWPGSNTAPRVDSPFTRDNTTMQNPNTLSNYLNNNIDDAHFNSRGLYTLYPGTQWWAHRPEADNESIGPYLENIPNDSSSRSALHRKSIIRTHRSLSNNDWNENRWQLLTPGLYI